MPISKDKAVEQNTFSLRYRTIDNRWEARIKLIENQGTHLPRFKYIYGATKEICKAKANEFCAKRNENDSITEDSLLDEWLFYWLAQHKAKDIQESTKTNYSYACGLILKRIGRVPLSSISSQLLKELVVAMEEDGMTRASELSLFCLKSSLKKAYEDRIIGRNPMDGVKIPTVNTKVSIALTKTEMELFIANLGNETIHRVFYFQLLTGLRLGEVRALKWTDIDLEAKSLTIQRGVRIEKGDMQFTSTKTRKSRVISLLPEAIEVIENQRIFQDQEKMNSGTMYHSHGLVFAMEHGEILTNSLVYSVFDEIKKRMKASADERNLDEERLNSFTPHCLRHTFATYSLKLGIPTKIVAQWLGHSSVRITGDIYSHITPDIEKNYIEILEKGYIKMV